MSQSLNALDLRFGAELELVVKSKTHNHASFEALASEVSSYLTAANVQNHVADLFKKDEEKYEDWSIIDELSITSRRKEHRFGLELVSPVLVFAHQPYWMGQIQSVWSALNKGFEVQVTNQCSTHIHLSPVQGTWTLSQVKGVAMAAVYFERCIDALVPGYRRINHWCRSNRWNLCFKELSMPQIFNEIQKQPTMEKVAEQMCLCPRSTVTGDPKDANKGIKYYTFRWNMTSISSAKGTIEFRLPPPSPDADHAIAWIMFTVSFVRWATQNAAKLDPSKPGELSHLLECVTQGAQLSHIPDPAPVRRLFKNAKALPEGPMKDLNKITPEDIKKLKLKAKERDISLEKYKKLFGYK